MGVKASSGMGLPVFHKMFIKWSGQLSPLPSPFSLLLLVVLTETNACELWSTPALGVRLQNWSDYISYRRVCSINRRGDVLCQLKIRGASEKFINQPRSVLRPTSVNFRQHFQNLSHKTVPLKSSFNMFRRGTLRNTFAFLFPPLNIK